MSIFSKQKSLWGLKAYISPQNHLVSQSAFSAGGEASVGRQGGSIVIPGSPDVVAIFDDFLGHIGDTGAVKGWEFVNGDADTGATGSIGHVSATNGVMRVNFTGTALNTPAAAIGFTGGLMKNWKANQKNLRFQARVKIPSLASVNAFIGFSDSGGAEMPAYDTGGGVITNAADAVGWMYSNLGGSTNWRGVSARSVAGDSGDQTINDTGGLGPTANVYDVLEIRFGSDSGDYADFYRNGLFVNRINQPVDKAVAMTPGVWLFGSDTGTIQVDTDYINVSANRDTGT